MVCLYLLMDMTTMKSVIMLMLDKGAKMKNSINFRTAFFGVLFLCALVAGSSMDYENNEPWTQDRVSYLSESDALRYELCFKKTRDMSNDDLNHFCEGATGHEQAKLTR